MEKFFSFLISWSVCGFCFSQTTENQDSLKTKPGKVLSARDSNPNKLKPELTIYPNPANSKITLQVKRFDPGMAVVKLLDTKGKMVRQDNRLLTNGTEDIIMFLMLKAGIYFILVSEPGKTARKKLVVL